MEGWGTNPFTFCWLVSFLRSGHDASTDVEGFLIQALSSGIKLPLRLRNLQTVSNSTSVQVIYGLVFWNAKRLCECTREPDVKLQEIDGVCECKKGERKQHVSCGFLSTSSHRLYWLPHQFWQLAVRTQWCTHLDLTQVRHSSLSSLSRTKDSLSLAKCLVWSESAIDDQNRSHDPLEKQDQLMVFFIWLDPFLFNFCCCRSIQDVRKKKSIHLSGNSPAPSSFIILTSSWLVVNTLILNLLNTTA